jgi:hypothetical protein
MATRKRWGDLKARLETFDRKGLVRLVADLYAASPANRRFLESRLLPGSGGIENYRQIVSDAIYPDPLSRRAISIRGAGAAIADYKRSTGDFAGTVDLMMTFVEAGTEQAADLGYGEDAYFNALESRLKAIVKAFDDLPEAARKTTLARLAGVRNRAKNIGWGYGDFVDNVVRTLEGRKEHGARSRADQR